MTTATQTTSAAAKHEVSERILMERNRIADKIKEMRQNLERLEHDIRLASGPDGGGMIGTVQVSGVAAQLEASVYAHDRMMLIQRAL